MIDAQEVIRTLGLRIGQLEVDLAVALSQIPAPDGDVEEAYARADELAREEAETAIREQQEEDEDGNNVP